MHQCFKDDETLLRQNEILTIQVIRSATASIDKVFRLTIHDASRLGVAVEISERTFEVLSFRILARVASIRRRHFSNLRRIYRRET